MVDVDGAGDRPAAGRPASLIPPAIGNAEVEPAVGARLHAAGTTGLEQPARSVEPDVGALHQPGGRSEVVVLDECGARFHAGKAGDLLAQLFDGPLRGE